jgi:TonB family protein
MTEGSLGRLAGRACLLLLLVGGGAARGQDVRQELRREPPRITRPPQLLHFQAAEYPEAARRQGISGTVELLITVGADGKVTEVSVLGAPHPSLAEAARGAALAFRFSPAEIDGKPGPVRIRYGYRFTLETRFTPRLPAWMEDRKRVADGADVLIGRVREQGTRAPLGAHAVAGTAARQDGDLKSRTQAGMALVQASTTALLRKRKSFFNALMSATPKRSIPRASASFLRWAVFFLFIARFFVFIAPMSSPRCFCHCLGCLHASSYISSVWKVLPA